MPIAPVPVSRKKPAFKSLPANLGESLFTLFIYLFSLFYWAGIVAQRAQKL